MKTIDLTISEEQLNTPICLHSELTRSTVTNEDFRSVIKNLEQIEEIFIDDNGNATNYSGYRLESSEDLNSDYGYIDFDNNKGTYEVFPLSDILKNIAPAQAIKAMKAELRRSGEIFWDEEANAAAIKALVACDELSAQEGLEYLGYDVDEMLEEEGEIEVINHGGYTETID